MRRTKAVTGLLSLLGALLLASCDYFYEYTYRVSNQTDTTVAVHYGANAWDTTVQVPPGATPVVLLTEHGVEKRNGPFYKPIGFDFKRFTAVKGMDTARKNFLLNETWTYSDGVYQATVSDSDF